MFASWIGLCVLFAMLCGTFAIFEEQLGEFDWKRENIGVVDASFVIRDELIVTTASGILACLDVDSGTTKWRAVLPPSSKVVKFVEVEGQLVTLVSSASKNDSSLMTVKSWSVSDGSLLWDTFLGTNEKKLDVLDVMFVSASRQITVLWDNTLHFITPPASQASSPLYWSWSASTDMASAPAVRSTGGTFSTSNSELTFALSSLIAPTYSPEHSEGSDKTVTRTAIGCFVQATVGKQCDGEVAVVTVGPNGVALEVFTALPDTVSVRAADLTAVVASEALLSYQSNDVVFAASRDGASLVILALNTNQVVSEFPLHGGVHDAVKTFVFVDVDGELRPAISLCSRSACQSLVAVAPSASTQAWTVQKLLAGAADCQGDDVRLQFGSYQFYDKVVHSVTCSALKSQDERLASVTLRSSAFPMLESANLAPLDVVLPPFYQPAAHVQTQHTLCQNQLSAVHHWAVLPTKTASAGGCVDRNLLVVLHSGHTFMLKSTCAHSSPSFSAVRQLWSRLEGLAGAQQAVVLDRTQVVADSDNLRVPTFLERLDLQRSKLLNFATSGGETFSAIVETVQDAVRGLTRPAAGRAGASGRKALKRRDVEKLKTFGFDKFAAVLCYSDKLASHIEEGSGKGVPFAEAGLQLMFVDLMRSPSQSHSARDEEVRSVRYLSLDSSNAAHEVVNFVKLLPNPAPLRRISSNADDASVVEAAEPVGKSLVLVVGTVAGRTYFWDIDPSGAPIATKVCSANGSCVNPFHIAQKVSVEPYTVRVEANERAGAPLSIAATSAFESPAYTILHGSTDSSDLAFVTILHDQHSIAAVADRPLYVHAVNKTTGRFLVYKTSNNKADIAACDALQYSFSASPAASRRIGLSCVPVRASSSMRFDPNEERIVAVTYPSAHDAVHVPYSILGDDSVLMKYLNPHVTLVTTIATAFSVVVPETGSESSGNADEGAAVPMDETASSVLYWTLLDTVTGKVILRLHQESATLPVHAILLENHIVSTYWNSKAKRTELSSVALYEGVIDNTELTPFASSRARSNSAFLAAAAASASSKKRSAYSSIPPIAMQKTYTLPRAVSALHHTVTAHGLSNKNLLLGLRNGQIYSVDMKQVHPRRPFSDPSTAEKTEGLVRYSPFVTLLPLSALTHNYSLPRGVSRIVSTSSNLESSSLVLSFGGAAVDMHLNRVMPSQDFDLLSSDFNYSLLVAILLALATAVLFLRNLQQRKHLSTIWA